MPRLGKWDHDRRVVIVDGVRTPFAKVGTGLADVAAVELARTAIRELVERTGLDGTAVDEIILGNTAPPAEAPNIARVAALEAGLPQSAPAFSVARNCASGFQSLTDAYNQIGLGQSDVVIAGGVESMSNVPLHYPDEFADVMSDLARSRSVAGKITAATQLRPAHLKPVVALAEGLTDPVCGLNMGETAEVLAHEFNLTREAQDEYALRSHQRAAEAWAAGRFADEVTPVFIPPGYRDVVAEDIGYRSEQSLEALAKLKAVFDRRDGTVTAGNSSMITDGAAALLLMEETRATELGYDPLGRIASFAFAGFDPRRMGLGPAVATPIALERAGVTLDAIDLIELNEAFAAQVIACQRELGFDSNNVNVNGGAISLGHPIGATGARIVVTLLHEMRRRDVELALATLCVSGGLGMALLVERS
ncbi:MAG: thiolase family protein [Gemmatimonadetes bacterium]|nr:thiolase family protein [Gemmatimonadota bacterium]